LILNFAYSYAQCLFILEILFPIGLLAMSNMCVHKATPAKQQNLGSNSN